MDIENIKRKRMEGQQRKTVQIGIRITPEASAWLREKQYSPTGIFLEALKELGYADVPPKKVTK